MSDRTLERVVARPWPAMPFLQRAPTRRRPGSAAGALTVRTGSHFLIADPPRSRAANLPAKSIGEGAGTIEEDAESIRGRVAIDVFDLRAPSILNANQPETWEVWE